MFIALLYIFIYVMKKYDDEDDDDDDECMARCCVMWTGGISTHRS